jgi:hypothetical protein
MALDLERKSDLARQAAALRVAASQLNGILRGLFAWNEGAAWDELVSLTLTLQDRVLGAQDYLLAHILSEGPDDNPF